MGVNYRHIGGAENRLGRHYSGFLRFYPTASFANQSLALRNLQDAGSNRRSRANWVMRWPRGITQACAVLRTAYLSVGMHLPFTHTPHVAVDAADQEIAALRLHRGYRGCTLLRRKGWRDSCRRIYRLYRLERVIATAQMPAAQPLRAVAAAEAARSANLRGSSLGRVRSRGAKFVRTNFMLAYEFKERSAVLAAHAGRRGNIATRRSQRTLDVLPFELRDQAILRIL
jgi:hypothetical protein